MAKKAAKKPLVVWVARDAIHMGCYGMFLREPSLGAYCDWFVVDDPAKLLAYNLCPKHFEPMMGIKLKPGEKRQFVWSGSPLKPYKVAKKTAKKPTKKGSAK